MISTQTLFLCFSLLTLTSCMGIQQNDSLASIEKINGVSLVASRERINTSHVKHISNINANYTAVIPFGFMRSLDSAKVIFNTDRQWRGERVDGVKESIDLLHNERIKVMLKPQLWIWHGAFTGDINMTSEENWKTLESTYEDYILLYARVAQETNVELFCIGTELFNFIHERPDFWKALITKVRTVYSGKITYAENWDKVDRVPFWNDLDYIGVDAYFPISSQKTPTIAESKNGWQQWKSQLQNLNKAYTKPVLFTEFGYRSVDYAGKNPWDSKRIEGQVNLDAQANLTQALFDEFWSESWFAGGFVWKWFHNHDIMGGDADNRFTPQNKPAETIIQQHYGLYQ